jgi:hypothetical protein
LKATKDLAYRRYWKAPQLDSLSVFKQIIDTSNRVNLTGQEGVKSKKGVKSEKSVKGVKSKKGVKSEKGVKG